MPRTKQSALDRALVSQKRWLKDDKRMMDEGSRTMPARSARKRVYEGDAYLSDNPVADKYVSHERHKFADGGKVFDRKPNGKRC
jgi:hypothetical protein